MAAQSGQRLSEEAHLNLAYRWFCKMDLSGPIPDHSTFFKIDMVGSATAMSCAMCLRRWSHSALGQA